MFWIIKKAATPEAAANDLSIENQSRDKREQHHQCHLPDTELEGVENGSPEHILPAGRQIQIVTALEQNAEILEPGKGPLARHQLDAPCGGIDQVDQNGQKGKQAKYHEVGPDKQPAQATESEMALGQLEQGLEQIEKNGKVSHSRLSRMPPKHGCFRSWA